MPDQIEIEKNTAKGPTHLSGCRAIREVPNRPNYVQSVPRNLVINDAIGSGGMAEVHSGYDIDNSRYVGIKIGKQEIDPENMWSVEEAEELKKLDHPNVVKLYDVCIAKNVWDPKDAYVVILVLEYFENETTLLQEINRSSKKHLDITEALNYVSQIACGADYIASQGTCWGDPKPGNVMIENGRVAIIDLGLARNHKADQNNYFTNGTPEYMAPEIVYGGPRNSKSDIYGIGVLAYETLTGKLPVGKNLKNGYEIMLAQVTDIPNLEDLGQLPISKRNKRKIEKVFRKVLSKNPNKRYKTATKFVEALKKHYPNTDKLPIG